MKVTSNEYLNIWKCDESFDGLVSFLVWVPYLDAVFVWYGVLYLCAIFGCCICGLYWRCGLVCCICVLYLEVVM